MSKKLKWNRLWPCLWPYLIFIMSALFILWAQKNSRAFFVGADSWFHINQFYESAMQIKTGHFSWFLALFGFGKAGRIVNGVYGPVFSYLVGGLLLFLGTWSRLQIVLNFLVLAISGSLMYHLCRYIRLKRNISIILGIVYLSSFPITTFVNEQTFSGIGDAILPLVILMGIKMWKSHSINIIPLAVLLAIILQIHLLTSVIAVIALIPFGIASFINSSHKPKWIINLIKSIALFFVLTCNIWGTMLDVFYHNNIIKPFPNGGMGDAEFSLGWFNGSISLLNNIFILIGIIVIALLMIRWDSLSKTQKFIPLLSLVFLILSSSYFPWGIISRKIPLISQTIQFPKRFLGIAVILLLLTLGKGIESLLIDSNHSNRILSFVVMGIMVFIAFSSITTEEGTIESHVKDWQSRRVFIVNNSVFHPKMHIWRIRKAYNQDRNISLAPQYTIKSIPDYLPSNRRVTPRNYYHVHPYGATMRQLFRYHFVDYTFHKGGKIHHWPSVKRIKSPLHFKKTVNAKGLNIEWNQPKNMAHKLITVPAVKYYHTAVLLNGHKHAHVNINKIGLIHLHPKAGRNKLTIHYDASILWKIMVAISIIAWLSLVSCWIRLKIKMASQQD